MTGYYENLDTWPTEGGSNEVAGAIVSIDFVCRGTARVQTSSRTVELKRS